VRSLKLAAVADFELFSRFTAILSFLSGAPVRAGFSNHTNEGLYRGNLLTHPVLYNPHQHMALNLLAVAEGSRASRTAALSSTICRRALLAPPQVAVAASDEACCCAGSLRDKFPHADADGPGPGAAESRPRSGSSLRGWASRNYVEVATALLRHSPRIVVGITGLKSSRALAAEILEAVGMPARTADFTGETPRIETLLALLRAARLLISTDGGSAHLASPLRLENDRSVRSRDSGSLRTAGRGSNDALCRARVQPLPFRAANHRPLELPRPIAACRRSLRRW